MTIRIMQVEIPFSPGSVLRIIWLESRLFQMSPERIDISDMKNNPTPVNSRAVLLQVDDRSLTAWNVQRRETGTRPTVEYFHPKHIPIEAHGRVHVSNLQGDRRNLLNYRLHSHSSVSCLAIVEFVFRKA